MVLAKKVIFFWLPPLVWMGLIFFLSSFHKLQASEIGWQDFVIRKFAHFLEYAILYFFNFRGLKNTTKFTGAKSFCLALLLTVCFAISDEYHQTFVSGRTGKPFDIGIDSLGAIFGLIFSWKIIKLLPKNIQKEIL